jgi:hypothetical protein
MGDADIAQDWIHILSDPDRKQLARMLDVGQRVSWPALKMVRNRMSIEVRSSISEFARSLADDLPASNF